MVGEKVYSDVFGWGIVVAEDAATYVIRFSCEPGFTRRLAKEAVR